MRETTNKFVAPAREIIISGKITSVYTYKTKNTNDNETVTFSLDSIPLEPFVFDMYRDGDTEALPLSWKGPVPFEMKRNGSTSWETGKKTWVQNGSGSAFDLRILYSNFDGKMTLGADQIGGITCMEDGGEKELDTVPVADIVETNRGVSQSYTEKKILAGFPRYIPERDWDPATGTFTGSEIFPLDANTTQTLKWNIYLGRGLDPEAEIIPPDNYPKWLPEAGEDEKSPGNTLDVRVTLKKGAKRGRDTGRKAKFIFELLEVSKETGVCLNWPPAKTATDDNDLRFEPDKNLLLRIENDGLRAVSEKDLYESRVVITSFDWGAYGKLKVTALLDNDEKSPVIATIAGKPEQEQLAIPKDDKDIHIGDAWSEEKGVSGYPGTWDEAMVPGQARNGDSLCLYDKYRGLMVMENGKKIHKRLLPRNKHLFIIDPDNVFVPGMWESTSSIPAYRLTADLVRGGEDPYESRQVNFNGRSPRKFAVIFEAVYGDYAIEDLMDPMPKKVPPTFGVTLFKPGTPKTSPYWAIKCMVYVKRIRDSFRMLNDLYVDSLESDGDVCGLLENQGISAQEQCLVWNAMRNAANNMEGMEKIVQKVIHATAIHEAGHACGARGHLIENENSYEPGKKWTESNVGDLHCPMRYLRSGDEEYRLIILNYFLGEALPLLEAGRFCSEGYNCFGNLNVNDTI